MARARIVFGTRGKNRYYVDDKLVTKAEFDKVFPTKIDDLLATQTPQATLMQTSKAWPKCSNAISGHGEQKAEMEAHAAKMGVPTEYRIDETGRAQAVLTSSAHQRDLCKALGYVNLSGGYGQITG